MFDSYQTCVNGQIWSYEDWYKSTTVLIELKSLRWRLIRFKGHWYGSISQNIRQRENLIWFTNLWIELGMIWIRKIWIESKYHELIWPRKENRNDTIQDSLNRIKILETRIFPHKRKLGTQDTLRNPKIMDCYVL